MAVSDFVFIVNLLCGHTPAASPPKMLGAIFLNTIGERAGKVCRKIRSR
jgi:hypothetical protein